jgi:hypothetical protein
MRTLLPALTAAALAAAAASADELRLVNDTSLTGDLVGVASDGRLQFRAGGEIRPFSGEDVFTIEINPDLPAVAAEPKTVVLSDGSTRFPAKAVALADGKVTVESRFLGKLSFPLEALSSARLAEGKFPDYDARLAQVAAAKRTKDTLLALGKDKLLELEGQLKSFDASEMRLIYEGQERKLQLTKVFAVTVAELKKPEPSSAPGPAAVAELPDGAKIAGKLVRVTVDGYVLAPTGLPEVTLARAHVRRLVFSSGRVVDVSSLTPTKVVERAGIQALDAGADDAAGKFPFRTDRNVHGGKLKLGGVEYRSGLGCHSYCELHYRLGGEFEKFTAVIGIDDSALTGPRFGDVVFVVKVDGKDDDKLRWPMKTGDKPVTISVPLDGAQTITLVVEQGNPVIDSKNWANWAGARLLRKK